MKIQTQKHQISVTLIQDVHLDIKELAWLREMANHCIATRMAGSRACEKLNILLDKMQIPKYHDIVSRGVYGLFEVE